MKDPGEEAEEGQGREEVPWSPRTEEWFIQWLGGGYDP